MARNRKTAKTEGTRFETAVTRYMSVMLHDERIQRLRLHGNKDVGDVGNVYFYGEKITIECKNTARHDYMKHYREATVEAGNNDSPYPWVVQKKMGVGYKTTVGVGLQLAYTHVDVLHRMLTLIRNAGGNVSLQSLTFIGRGGCLACLSLQDFLLLVNSGIPLD